MKKTVITFLASCLLITGLKAQTIQEGKSHLYAQRYISAKSVFEKILATNPNNIEAIYWLGQTLLETEEIAGARRAAAKQLYEKGLQSSANAPLIQVGMGHVELLENKNNEARQRFETALTMTRTRKGDDPMILTAIGRANVAAKNGDFNYAISKLVAAVDKGEKNAEMFLELGNAYRKARPGEGGGDAYKNYNKALEIDKTFAPASLRLAQLFESQKNSELILQYLNDAVTRDPKFSAGYYELFYYYFYRLKFQEAEVQLKKYIDSKLPEKDIADEYLYAQLCWARKDFACAIPRAESVVASMGDLTKPKVYRLLADAYFQNNDVNNAKKYSDLFFVKKNPDDINSFDYKLKADILSKTGGTPEEILNTYLQGAPLDTVLTSRIDFLKQGAAYFKGAKLREQEAQLLQVIIDLKPKPTINDYFDLATAHYFSQKYELSRNTALKMIELFPDQIYGYEWAYNNSIALVTDTTKPESFRDSLKLAWAGPDASKMYEFSQKDTVKHKKQYLNSVKYLAQFYINMKKDKEKSLEFFEKWLQADPVNAVAIQQYIDQVKKMTIKPGTTSPNGRPVPPKVVGAKTPSKQPASKTGSGDPAVSKK